MLDLKTSYGSILRISFPIMLGSAAQNMIVLIDSVFLYHLGELDFAAIGFVGVFYLIIAAIGYGFSKGGQIMIARKLGERAYPEVGKSFRAMLVFELILATLMFAFMQFGSYYFFTLLVDSEVIFQKSMEYLEYRSWGVFFAYAGVSIIALYTGIARTKFIVADTVVLVVVNTAFCYALIFGHWGFPKMGIGGAGLSSTIAEAAALFAFLVYMIFDGKLKPFKLLNLGNINWDLVKVQYQLSIPIIVQMVIGLGSWFLFFGIVENMGERQLAISNLARMVYLILSVPTWGFASGINTLVSGFIGARKRQAVYPITWKTAKVCWAFTMVLSLPVILFPETLLYPLLGKSDMSLITETQPLFYLMLVILSLFSVGAVFFNGIAGTGATYFGLKLQLIAVLFYVVYVYLVVEVWQLDLVWAWAAEAFYWAFLMVIAMKYLRSGRWQLLKIWKIKRNVPHN